MHSDQLTTGALVLARTLAHARELSQQFASHAVAKSYLALVRAGTGFPDHGGVITDKLWVEEGRVSLAPKDAYKRKAGHAAGVRKAETAWELVAKSVRSLPFNLSTGL
jgi:23S rRNA-/tRNA-specific pseudouridylate synthase